MQEFILKENVLTDNILILADKGKAFKGNYIAIIKEYSFQNSWSDKLKVKKFRKKETLNKYLEKHYPEISYMYDFGETCLN
jgi:hypothetical protein